MVGSNSLLDFASFADPEAAALPEGTTCDWTSFRLSEDDAVVKYAGGEGRWVVFPSSNGNGDEEAWSVKWKGGKFFSPLSPFSLIFFFLALLLL